MIGMAFTVAIEETKGDALPLKIWPDCLVPGIVVVVQSGLKLRQWRKFFGCFDFPVFRSIRSFDVRNWTEIKQGFQSPKVSQNCSKIFHETKARNPCPKVIEVQNQCPKISKISKKFEYFENQLPSFSHSWQKYTHSKNTFKALPVCSGAEIDNFLVFCRSDWRRVYMTDVAYRK